MFRERAASCAVWLKLLLIVNASHSAHNCHRTERKRLLVAALLNWVPSAGFRFPPFCTELPRPRAGAVSGYGYDDAIPLQNLCTGC